MRTKEAQEIWHGDVLGDGFVVESIYMPLGSAPHVYFAMGYPYGIRTRLCKQHLGRFGRKLTVKG